MCRGNNGQSIFEPARLLDCTAKNEPSAGKGRRLFLSTLEEVCQQIGWRIHAYVLMGNHYHLLLETPEANLVAGMKWFQGTYTQRFNLYSAVGKFTADARSRPAGVAIYSKGLETKQMRQNRQPVFGLKC
jgi:REP element-mobilizing transposase RayT